MTAQRALGRAPGKTNGRPFLDFGSGRRLGLFGLYATIALMAIPASAVAGPTSLFPAIASNPSASHSAAPVHATAVPTVPTHRTPPTAGLNPATNVPVNAPAIVDKQLSYFITRGLSPVPTTASSGAAVSGTSVGTSGHTAATTVGSTASSSTASSTATPSPPPAATTIATGTLTGFVYQWRTGQPLQGVTVQAYSTGGAICPDYICAQVVTAKNGSYTAIAPVGNDYLQFTLAWNLTNETYVTAYNGITTYVASTFLVPDGIGYGYVYGNTTGSPPLTNVLVCATSRDQLVQAQPCASTANGYYKVALPPSPSIVRFTPEAGYLDTFLFTNATPHFPGDPLIELGPQGAVYLTHLVNVRAELYNSVSKGSVPSGSCTSSPLACYAMTVCSSITASCQLQGNSVSSNTVQAFGVPGPAYVEIYATGFVSTNYFIGNISRLSPGQTDDVGKIYLVPLAAADMQVGITTNGTSYASMWGTGLWVETVQSMAGYQTGFPTPTSIFSTLVNMSQSGSMMVGCAGIGSRVQVGMFPGMNDVVVRPDYTPTCSLTPTWPIPGDLPVWDNETYVNGTPETAVTQLSGGPGAQSDWLNFTAGTYIYGHVAIQGHPYAPRNYSVAATSTDSNSYRTYGFTWNYLDSYSGWSEVTNGWACAEPMVNSSFCVPAPDGNSQITVSGLGYPNNWTWAFTHVICCEGPSERTGMFLSQVTQEHTMWINLTAQGSIRGGIYRTGTNLGVAFGGVQVCTAKSDTLIPGMTCYSGTVLTNGSFSSAAPLGWDYITATASGYEANSEWAFVNGTKEWVGNITLTPVGVVDGYVVDPYGNALLEAQVETCLLQSANACSSLGIGQTSTDGYYNGSILGGWLPWSTYEIQATASGYTTDWTFVNATPGVAVHAPTLTLQPVGVSTTLAPQGKSTVPAGSWIYGTLLDEATGDGIGGANIQACSVGGSGCTVFIYSSNSLGQFNQSVAPGIYVLSVSAAGYAPVTKVFNATAAAFLSLGDIYMTANPWVTGVAYLNPWGENITIPQGTGSTTIAIGPAATATACNPSHTSCGIGIAVPTNGEAFNVSAPSGLYNTVTIQPTGTGVGPSVPGGESANTSVFNQSGYVTPLNSTIPLDVFASVGGFIFDNGTVNPQTAQSPWLPVKYMPVSLQTTGPKHATATGTTNGGGFFDFFVPAGPSYSYVSAFGSIAFTNGNATYKGLLAPGQAYWTNSTLQPNMTIRHFGFVDVYTLNSVTNVGAGYISATSTYYDAKNRTTYTAHSNANGAGLLNLSAMFGNGVKVYAGGSQDYNSTTFYVSVNSSATTFAGTSDPVYIPSPFGVKLLNPWGIVISESLNNSTGITIPTVLDQAKQLPLPGVSITVSSSDPFYGFGTSQLTNYQGQFFSDAPVGGADVLTTARYGFLGNSSTFPVTPGEEIVKPYLNVTGDAVVAGRVVGLPGSVPISGAAVSICASKGACFSATTNASGIFWVLAAPGQDSVTASADNYVTNSTAVTPVKTCSDCWTWMGNIELNQYAYVAGTIRGLPDGLLVAGASVDLCSPLGVPTGPCGFTVTTGANGAFLLEAPSGTYILAANASGYNVSYRPLALSPGEHASMGTMFLEQFGNLQGFVYSATSLARVSGAQVYACAKWGGGSCTAPVTTDQTGSFFVSSSPGPYELTVSAPGYNDGYVSATIAAGATNALAPIFITPLGTDVAYTVAGEVVNASNPSQGVGGAILSLSVGGAPAFSTVALRSGAFSFLATYGTYTLTVSAPGYHPAVRSLVVNGPISGLIVAIPTMLYNVTGVVKDGLSGSTLGGVNFYVYGTSVQLASSAQDGTFRFALANGTTEISAGYAGPQSQNYSYGTVVFAIAINGQPQTHDLELFPAGILVKGVVVNALNGLPLGNAQVLVAGQAADGTPIAMSVTSDAAGAWSVTLPTGSYSANTTVTGYNEESVTFQVAPPGAPVTLALQPTQVSSIGSGRSTTMSALPLYAGLGVVVAVLLAIGLYAAWDRNKRLKAARAAKAAQAAPPSKGASR